VLQKADLNVRRRYTVPPAQRDTLRNVFNNAYSKTTVDVSRSHGPQVDLSSRKIHPPKCLRRDTDTVVLL
jgi:hypothetical protein